MSCPTCSDASIEKLPTAKIRKTETERPQPQPEAQPQAQTQASLPVPAGDQPKNLHELIDLVLLSTENVGTEFPAEARRIHYQEVPHRNIRGVASREETEELLEEGIAVMPLPVPPRKDWQ